MLFFIIGLGSIHGHRSQRTDRLADLIVSINKHSIIILVAPAVQCLKGLSVRTEHGTGSPIDSRYIFRPLLADHRKLTAGDNDTFTVNDTDGAISIIFQLKNYILKNSSRHSWPPKEEVSIFCAICQHP